MGLTLLINVGVTYSFYPYISPVCSVVFHKKNKLPSLLDVESVNNGIIGWFCPARIIWFCANCLQAQEFFVIGNSSLISSSIHLWVGNEPWAKCLNLSIHLNKWLHLFPSYWALAAPTNVVGSWKTLFLFRCLNMNLCAWI